MISSTILSTLMIGREDNMLVRYVQKGMVICNLHQRDLLEDIFCAVDKVALCR